MKKEIKSVKAKAVVDLSLLKEIRQLITAARSAVVQSIDYIQVHTCFKIGRRIVEHEQKGLSRAEYGKSLIQELAAKAQNWSLRELKRQFNSSLYERLALSRNKQGIRELSRKGQIVEKAQDVIKNPYVLEFLGIDEHVKYSESDLESAIIDKLEHFLLELGKGFLFEARQKRFTFDEDHFLVDLVFYNRLLGCYVLIDLKIGELTHQDLGQMQMYVNYFDRHVKAKNEGSTIGIILCRKNREALVEITLPKDANIHAKEYRLYLPSKEELKRKLLYWTKDNV